MRGSTGAFYRNAHSTGTRILHKHVPQTRLESGNSIRLKPPARACVVVVDSMRVGNGTTDWREREYDECTGHASSAVYAKAFYG